MSFIWEKGAWKGGGQKRAQGKNPKDGSPKASVKKGGRRLRRGEDIQVSIIIPFKKKEE